MEPTPEEIAEMVTLVRILVGDTPGSIFYPIMSDEDITAILKFENWNVLRAARRVAISIAFQLTSTSTRERSGDIEVWNSSAMEYQRVLNQFLDESNGANLPSDLIPYAAGISKSDVCASNNDPDKNRSPLSQITPCLAWWTRVDHYPCCDNGVFNWNIK